MTRAELEALAVRVETEEPSDDLNWAVGQTQPVVPGKPRWLDYTTSIDAAVTLVPPGWRWTLWGHGEALVWRDRVSVTVGDKKRFDTPAAALTAAALRALAMEAK